MGTHAWDTRKVKRALEVIGLEEQAHDIVSALALRDLVVIDRSKLMDIWWLEQRIGLIEDAARIEATR